MAQISSKISSASRLKRSSIRQASEKLTIDGVHDKDRAHQAKEFAAYFASIHEEAAKRTHPHIAGYCQRMYVAGRTTIQDADIRLPQLPANDDQVFPRRKMIHC